jgi:outer membrane murein-binding lipoprotein Lpp
MKRIASMFSVFAVVGMVFLGLAGQADAQKRNERETRDIVRSLNSKVDDFKYNLDYQLKSASMDQDSVTDVSTDLRDLKDKIKIFETNLNARRENRDDVSDIVQAANNIDDFLETNQQSRKLQNDWMAIRGLLDRLANSYGVSADQGSSNSNYPSTSRDPDNYPAPTRTVSNNLNNGLTGTYQLDTARSENIADILSNSNVAGGNKHDLESKLEAPEQVAISIRGNQVTLASTKAAPITITADGREKTENSGGKTVRVRATLRGDQLTVSSLGGETDYTITFVTADNGKTLKVTRRITTDYLRETIFAESVYNKTDAVAQLGIDDDSIDNGGTYSSNDPNDVNNPNPGSPSIVTPRIGEFIVPNGTVISGVLENPIDTKVSQNNDLFRLTVQSPDEFRGAIVEGYISGVGRSGQISGRSNITFNFQKITLRDGKAYDFAGSVQGIKDTFGKDVKVDTEGTAKGESQTKETAKRGGVGAGIGALIGAIAGGGKGAVIGAIIGGGAGAGSVAVQGRDDIQLQKGSVITVTSSSPIRNSQQSKIN